MTTVAAERFGRPRYARGALLPRGWPVFFFFTSLPLAWLLGFAKIALPVYGALLFSALLLRGGIRVPARFGLWLLFLVWVVVSGLELESSDRAFAYGYRTSLYLTATALFIYIFLSSRRELPTRTVVQALTLYWGVVVVGGFLGVALPSVSLPSLAQYVLALVLPGDIANVRFVQDITTPGFADVQRILGFAVGRPKTFFSYANEWASTLVVLTPFALLGLQSFGRTWRRVIGALLILSVIPLVFSLSRGAWIALLALVFYASVRLAAERDLRALRAVTASVAIAALLIFATPLVGLIGSRLEHGHSDEGRLARDFAALELTEESPLFGHGAPQPSATDEGSPAVGTHGQLFLLLVSQGIPGFLFFLGWFLYSLWRTGRGAGASRVVFWCHTAILVFLVMTPFYELAGFQLMVVAAAMAIAWREIARPQAPSADRGMTKLPRPAVAGAASAVPQKRAPAAREVRPERRRHPRPPSRRTHGQGAAVETTPSAATADLHHIDLSAVARGGVLSLIGGFAFALLGFALVLVVSHGLGATGAGVFFEAVAIFVIVTRIAQIGADVGVVRELPRLLALGRAAEIRQTLVIALAPVALVGAAIGTALYVLAPAISGLVINGTPPASLVSYIRLWAPFLVLAALSAVILAAARGLGSFVPFVSIENIGKPALQPLLALLVVGLGLGTTGMALAWAIPIAIGFGAAVWWVGQLVERAAPVWGPLELGRSVGARAKEFWSFASPRALAAVFQAMAAWADILLVGALASARAAGIYAAASRLVLMGTLFLRALILVLGPQISSLLARDLRQRAQVVYQGATWWLTLLSWPLYILLAVFAPVVVGVFGEEFAAGDKALAVLAGGMLVSMACGPVSVVLLMAGKSSWNLFNTIFSAGLGVGLGLMLIPRYGVVGAAIAAAATVAANNLIPLAQVWGYLRLHPLGRGFLIVASSALFSYGIGGTLTRLLLGSTPVALAVASVLGTIVYVALLRRSREVLRFDVIRDVVRARGRRGGTGATPAS